MPYVAGLDGVRAVAILLVLLFHAKTPGLPGASLGVDVFFVLSGFLITRLLLVEYSRNGVINLRNFYIRRALRLTPPLVLFLVCYAVFSTFVWPDYPFHLRDGLLMVFYMVNISAGAGFLAEKIAHGWSLGLEEQFYLLWPVFLGAVCHRAKLWQLLLVIYFSLGLWRWFNIDALGVSWDVAYYRPDLHCSGLVLGAALAAWLQQLSSVPRWVCKPLLWIVLPLFIFLIASPHSMKLYLLLFVPVMELCAVLLVLWLLSFPSGLWGRFLAAAPMVFLGKLSYGLYLFHYPIMVALVELGLLWWQVLVLGGGASLLLAGFSYFTIEAWVRRYRQTHYAEPRPSRR